VITCSKCGKENQDHYKFCLGCGAELPRGSSQAKPFTSNTPPHGVPAMAAPAPAPAPPPSPLAATAAVAPAARPASHPDPPAASAPPAGVACPQCGHVNAGNRFCASCGYNLGALAGASPSVPAAAAAAPAPGGAGIVLTALRADGSEAGTFRMPDAPVV